MSADLDIPALAAAAIKPDDFEPMLRRFADDLYGKLLDDVRDYMVDNTQYNIGQTIDSLKYERDGLRATRGILLAALVGLLTHTHVAESDPADWEPEDHAVESAARAAIARACMMEDIR